MRTLWHPRVKVVANMHDLLVFHLEREQSGGSACSAESALHGTAACVEAQTLKACCRLAPQRTPTERAIRVASRYFAASVFRKLTNNLFGTSKESCLERFFSQCFWKIAHLIKKRCCFRPESLLNLCLALKILAVGK